MDPDVVLAKAREMYQSWLRNGIVGDHLAANEDADDLVTLFHDLDEWLSRGGFLPSDWHRNAVGGE